MVDGKSMIADFEMLVKGCRDFSGGHARRLPSGMRASAPGELVQVDHMSVSRDGQTLKEFRAVCPAAKLMFCLVFSRATDSSRTEFWTLYSGELTVAEAAPALAKFQHFYNTVRPHMSMDWKTPFEYLSSALGLPAQSHMC